MYFNPLPPQRGRPSKADSAEKTALFQSTPSPKRETLLSRVEFLNAFYFNPLPPQRGRLCGDRRRQNPHRISIHSLPKEGDFSVSAKIMSIVISIHSLPKEGDSPVRLPIRQLPNFNPLPPQRGRHGFTVCLDCLMEFQSTPSPKRETIFRWRGGVKMAISIHSLPKEGDFKTKHIIACCIKISIHSLPKEGDVLLPV